MGLLDDWPSGWLGLLGNGAQYQNQNGGIGTDAANYPLLSAPQPQRLPLSFAGPALAAGFPDRAQAQIPVGNPVGAFPNGFGAVPSVQSAPSQGFARPLTPTTQNLTAHVLRTKGVPETDIAAAIGDPVLMQQLVNQNFGTGSAGTPAKVGYPAFNGNANSAPSGHADQRVDPGNNGLDDDRARPPPWGRFTQSDPIGYTGGVNRFAAAGNDARNWMDPTGSPTDRPFGFNAPNQALPSIFGAPIRSLAAQSENSKPPRQDKPVHLAQMFAFPPVSLFARPPIYIPRQLTPLGELPKGSANGPRAGMDFLRNEGKPSSPEEYPPCTYCGEETGPGRFHRDHIIPRSRGGNGSEDNRVPACPSCNIHKGARTPEEWYADMLNGV